MKKNVRKLQYCISNIFINFRIKIITFLISNKQIVLKNECKFIIHDSIYILFANFVLTLTLNICYVCEIYEKFDLILTFSKYVSRSYNIRVI